MAVKSHIFANTNMFFAIFVVNPGALYEIVQSRVTIGTTPSMHTYVEAPCKDIFTKYLHNHPLALSKHENLKNFITRVHNGDDISILIVPRFLNSSMKLKAMT